MTDSKNRPVNDSSTGENQDDHAKGEDAALRLPEVPDAPPLSPNGIHELERAAILHDDRSIDVRDPSHLPEMLGAPQPSPGESHAHDSAGTHNGGQLLTAGDASHVPTVVISPSLLPGKSDEIGTPYDEATLIARGLKASNEVVFRICARICMLITFFRNDRGALHQLLSEFGEKGVLTPNDVRLSLSSSKLSKLREIGEHAEVLLRLNLEIGAAYSVAYAAVVLFKMLPGDPEERTHALLALQRDRGGVLTRTALQDETRALKKSKSGGEAKRKARIENQNPGRGHNRKPTEVPPSDVVLITPGDQRARFVAHFSEDIPKAGVNLGPLSDLAIVVLVTSLHDFANYWTRLFRGWGLNELEPVMMTKMPANPNITREEIVVFATKSVFARVRIKIDPDTWLEEVAGNDWRTVVGRLIPDAGRKRHLFALDDADGWDCVIGEESWD